MHSSNNKGDVVWVEAEGWEHLKGAGGGVHTLCPAACSGCTDPECGVAHLPSHHLIYSIASLVDATRPGS